MAPSDSATGPPPSPPPVALVAQHSARHLVMMHLVQFHHVGVRLAQTQGSHFALRIRLQPGGRADGGQDGQPLALPSQTLYQAEPTPGPPTYG